MRKQLACLVALTLSGCVSVAIPNGKGASKVPDGASVALSGKVLDAAGQPAANLNVHLEKVISGDFTAYGKAQNGSSALAHDTKADAKGAYAITLASADAKNAFNEPIDYDVRADRDDRAFVDHVVTVDQVKVGVPDLQFWDGLSAPAAGAKLDGDLVVSWTAPKWSVNAYRVSLSRQGTGGVYLGPGDTLWTQTVRGATSLTIPAYVMDPGTTYTVGVTALSSQGSAGTPTRDVTAPAAAKKTAIAIQSAKSTGENATIFYDGDPYKGSSEVQSGGLVLDLGTSQAVGHVVLYQVAGLKNTLYAFVGDDPVKLPASPAGQGTSTNGSIEWMDLDLKGAKGRYVRLQSRLSPTDKPSTFDTFTMAEARVFAP